MKDITYVGLDVHKATVCVAIQSACIGVSTCGFGRMTVLQPNKFGLHRN
jgi:hypothetical protein